nr:putative ABC transporter C family member 15 isoform X2 [Setaria viridis]
MDRGSLGLLVPTRTHERLHHGGLLHNSSNPTMLQYLREWPELYSPSFWMGAFTLMQLIFIISMSSQYLINQISWCRQRLKIAAPDEHSYQDQKNTVIKQGVSYQASKACCLLMLAVHILRVFLLQFNERLSNCMYPSCVLSEGLQVLSFIILSIAVSNFQETKSTKLPLIVRSWWILNFLQSITMVVFDLRSILSDHEHIGYKKWTNLFNLGVCTYLFAVSARGTTGIRITFTDSSITEPLLTPSVGQQMEAERTCLYGRAGILQFITFSWMNPIIAIGYRKTLDQNDVPDLDGKDSAEFLSDSFKKIINDVEHRHGDRQYGHKRGYLLALALLSAKVIQAIADSQWRFGAQQLGMRLQAALISHVYQKGLQLSFSSRQKHTSGEIINYMDADIQRISDFLWYTNYIWMLPIELFLAVCVLYQNLGAGAWAGLAATLAVMVCNIPLTSMQKKLQAKIMAAKDERMKATTEVLRSMKILKLQAWDMQYLQKIEASRSEEYKWLWRSQRLSALTTLVFWGAPAFISSVTFGSCILMGIPLTAGSVLSALATFRMLQNPIFRLPDLLSVFARGKVSADRVAKYLQEEELKCDAVTQVPRSDTCYAVEIYQGTFSWELETTSPTLPDVQLRVKRGMKVAICGMVGSGKSSLLSCILGEMPKRNGTVRVSGSKAYVPQTAWILSGNIRDNILFGNPYDKEKYERIVQACALTKDIEMFANGDLTEIGERGINMSGGQKQRIQIARSMYEDADIYLFDDPFSAVDAHTGSQIFKDCVMGIPKDKTVLYVTHQVEFLPAADLILVMQGGKIVQEGKFDELLQKNIGFEAIVGAHSQALESVMNAESSSRISSDNQKSADTEDDLDAENKTDDQLQGITKQESARDVSHDTNDKGRLTQDEEREKGGIGKKVYWVYLRTVHGGALVPIIIAAQLLFQIFQVASNYWMAWASPPSSATNPTIGLGLLFSVYITLSMGSALCIFARSMLTSLIGLLTSEKLFKNMIHCILRAPMSFFDSTPTGRILNRASSDQRALDMDIANKLSWSMLSVIQILGTIGVMSQVAWPVFAIFIPVMVVSVLYQRYQIPAARELARLNKIQRAPILHHFAESLLGASSIRAYGQKDRFIKANLGLFDSHFRPWFYNFASMEWLSLRLAMLSTLVFAVCLILLVSLPEGLLNPSIAGLAVTYALNLNYQLTSMIWNITSTENKMISVERILQYSRIPSEAPLLVDYCRPPTSWPQNGTISIRCLEVRYAEHLPSILRSISCTIPGGKKVGIVGRTGSGKSTFIQALFRIVEPREGTIKIDNVDICKIGLHDLRGRLSIIPQDPTMFEGTVRGNLDPLNEYSDQRVWEVLDKCQLGDIVRQNPKKLDSTVFENGENWSVGQRQLFCLGRVLLKRSNILVLDEATASVDSSTDAVIQETVRQEFRDCTVLTVAHRIHTVVDSDLILVFSEGRIVEYDTPSKLLKNENSEFSRLVKEYSRRSHCSSGRGNNCNRGN